MAELQGPRTQYGPETVYRCIRDFKALNLETPMAKLDEHEKTWQLREFCGPLVEAVKHPTEHLACLHSEFVKLLPTTLDQHPNSCSAIDISDDSAHMLHAKQLLSRLPSVPQRLLTLTLSNSRMSANKGTIWDGIRNSRWALKYIMPEARSHFQLSNPDDPESILRLIGNIQDIAWANLYVTSYIDTNNMIFLLKISSLGHEPDLDFARSFQKYVNLLGELIDEYETLVDAANLGYEEPFNDPAPSVQLLKAALFPKVAEDHVQSLSILKAFLWSAWQRSITLYFYYVIGVQLWQGSSSTWSSLLAVNGVRRLIDLDAELYRGDSTQYLCNWAFEMLRTSRTSLALDFRRMISLFDRHFQDSGGRCIQGSNSTCKGDLPESCQRFTGSEAKSQSLHATGCDGHCSRIRWSETSYRQCASPRAVSAERHETVLRYRKASLGTMAISHVWSHGQGGRPEDGINVCLHRRYCNLAATFGCESYWIDSACIPDDTQLRKEAIMTINDIFCDSKVTLISDKDLQSNLLSSPPSTRDLEILLSVLLVCDWGVRAWTMLEAIRGNKSIHILCGNDKAVRLTDLLRKIHSEGAIDLAVLIGSAQHLLPSFDAGSAKAIEETGHLLSQRHASRDNDEITIWGLLSNLEAPKNALELWQAHSEVNAGFLLSSAPRIQGQFGYGWAPVTPYIRPRSRSVPLQNNGKHNYRVRYPSYDGRGSYSAKITPQGLWSKWLIHDLDENYITELWDACVDEMMPTQWTDQHLEKPLFTEDSHKETQKFERPDYANACYTLKNLLTTPNIKVRVIRPVDNEGAAPYVANNARGEDFIILVIICVCTGLDEVKSHNKEERNTYTDKWQWSGIYEWRDDSHPDWKIEAMLIV
jgi:hypothetical protein